MKRVYFYLRSLMGVFVSPRRAFQNLAQDNNPALALIWVWSMGFLMGQSVVWGCISCGPFEWGGFFLHWVEIPLLAITLVYGAGYFIHTGSRFFGGKGRLGPLWVVLGWANLPLVLVSLLCLGALMFPYNPHIPYSIFWFYIGPAWVFVLSVIGISTVKGVPVLRAVWLAFLGILLSIVPWMAVDAVLRSLEYFGL